MLVPSCASGSVRITVDHVDEQLVTPINIIDALNNKIGTYIEQAELSLGDPVVRVSKGSLAEFFSAIKIDSELGFDLLLDVTAVDWVDQRPERYEVVYHLMSSKHRSRLRVLVAITEQDPTILSLTNLYKSAHWLEREVFDMFGINFTGHPDLRRILMYPEFKGHPLRKDYPVQGKQPRVRLIKPEVRNTAMDLVRAPLVAINKRKKNVLADDSPGENGRFIKEQYS